jgi:hypothetical protein
VCVLGARVVFLIEFVNRVGALGGEGSGCTVSSLGAGCLEKPRMRSTLGARGPFAIPGCLLSPDLAEPY